MPDTKSMTKTQRINWNYAVDAHRMVEWDMHNAIKGEMGLPPAWDEIWKDDDRRDPRRLPVTIRLDATDYVLRPDEVMLPDHRRPTFGDFDRMKAEMGEKVEGFLGE